LLGVIVIVATRRTVFVEGIDVDGISVSGLAKTLAVLSLLIWVTAITAGRLMAYV